MFVHFYPVIFHPFFAYIVEISFMVILVLKLLKNSFIRGTFYLTVAGFLSRIIGFFFRIFTAHAFGEEAMGIFQLTAPVMALSYSLCCSGFQTALSKYVAQFDTSSDTKKCYQLLFSCICITLISTSVVGIFVYSESNYIAANLLKEPRCASLLKILSLSFPLSAIHCCINGFYYGKKKTSIPSILQLCEQCIRVGSIFLLYTISVYYYNDAPIFILMAGNVIAEGVVAIISFFYILVTLPKADSFNQPFCKISKNNFFPLIKMAIPLSASRVIVNLLQSIEAIYIPEKLKVFGMNTKEALSTYGVLTGMALSLILFPTAITNSVAVLLLPYVSNADARGNIVGITKTLKKILFYCLLMGIFSTTFFYLFAPFLGQFLFHSSLAGTYIRGLSFICPFLYLNTTLSSTLNGLGRSISTFFVNTCSLLIRIMFVFLLIPHIGISGYLIGLLCSQLSSCLLYLFFLRKYICFRT